MRKIIINDQDLLTSAGPEGLGSIIEQTACPAENCGGQVIFSLEHRISGAVALCNKCQKGVFVKQINL